MSCTRWKLSKIIDCAAVAEQLRDGGITGTLAIYVEGIRGRAAHAELSPAPTRVDQTGFTLTLRLASWLEARQSPAVLAVPTYLAEYLPYPRAVVVPWLHEERVFGAFVVGPTGLDRAALQRLVAQGIALAERLHETEQYWYSLSEPACREALSSHNPRTTRG